MATLTTQAKTYEPHGDPDHVAYGADFTWSCTCGKSSAFVTTKRKAEHRAESHEDYCMHDGTVTVDVIYDD